MKEKCTINSN